jgi:hypothetical protein
MSTNGQLQLQSTTWLQRSTADRPTFNGVIRRTFSKTQYQVFAMPRGMLFLEKRISKSGGGGTNTNAIVAGAVLGGAIGAVIGAAIASSMETASAVEKEENLDIQPEEVLIELARTRKKSFVAKYDEINSLTIDAPGGMARLFADSTLAGWLTLRDQCLGKITVEIHEQPAMAVAVENLPRRLGSKVQINVDFDQQALRFVPKYTARS